MKTNVVECDIVRAGFSDSPLPLISDLKLTVLPGRFVSILGPSGAGKTTLLRIIAGLESNYTGFVAVGGNPVTAPRSAVQLVFQDRRLLPWKTAMGNVLFAATTGTRAQARIRAAELLDQFQINHRADAWPRTLSGGEQSRVALARALMVDPTVVLMDEALKGLDLASRLHLCMLLRRLQEKKGWTGVMVSHDVDDALAVSDEILVVSANPMRVVLKLEVPRDPGSATTSTDSALRARIIQHLTIGAFLDETRGGANM